MKKNFFNSKTFADQLEEIKNVFKVSYDKAEALNKAIEADIEAKEEQIKNLENDISYNRQVAENNNKFLNNLKHLLS